VVQRVVAFLHFAYEELTINENDIGQILHLVNVAKNLPCLCRFFATSNMHKLVVHQIEADDEHYLLDAPLVLFQHLGARVGRRGLLGFVFNVPKVM
jgi:hypothetical protein